MQLIDAVNHEVLSVLFVQNNVLVTDEMILMNVVTTTPYLNDNTQQNIVNLQQRICYCKSSKSL